MAGSSCVPPPPETCSRMSEPQRWCWPSRGTRGGMHGFFGVPSGEGRERERGRGGSRPSRIDEGEEGGPGPPLNVPFLCLSVVFLWFGVFLFGGFGKQDIGEPYYDGDFGLGQQMDTFGSSDRCSLVIKSTAVMALWAAYSRTIEDFP